MESAQQSQIITITPKAAEKVSEFMKQEGKDNLFLRVYVSGGGCSGLSYGMGFEEKSDEDDYNPNVTKSCSCGHSFSTDG